ncbi:MAG: response regulator [Myxococcales bacterium]|nr:response regulator [Myxococcales bacterium]
MEVVLHSADGDPRLREWRRPLGIFVATVGTVLALEAFHRTILLGLFFDASCLTTPSLVGAGAALMLIWVDRLNRQRVALGTELERRQREFANISATLESRIAERTNEVRDRDRALEQVQRMESVGQLAGAVAHDFNNMLTAILGSANYLKYNELDRQESVEIAQEILDAAHRSAALTRQLLVLSRNRSQGDEAFDLRTAVGSIRPMIERVCGEGINLTIDVTAAELPATGPRDQFEQVVLNLIVNATHAVGRRGNLSVSLKPCEHGALPEVLSASMKKRFAELRVTDDGCGMDSATLQRAFDPFFTTKPIGKGTGLGLAAARQTLRQWGGEITLESSPGKGTTARVFVPIGGKAAAPRARRRSAAASVHAGRERLLIVDDEASLRKNMRRTLKQCGYEITEASSAEEALGVLRGGQPFDLVVTDVVMGGMTGAEMATEIEEEFPDLKVLFISGYAPDDLFEALDAPVEMLSKPFSPKQLTLRVRKLLED